MGLGAGKREILDLELVKFKQKRITSLRGGVEILLWGSEEIPPVHINSILRIMDEFYSKEKTEFIEDLIEAKKDVLVHIYREDGIIAVEDYEKRCLTLQLKAKDKDRLLKRIDSYDWESLGPLYKIAEMKELYRE